MGSGRPPGRAGLHRHQHRHHHRLPRGRQCAGRRLRDRDPGDDGLRRGRRHHLGAPPRAVGRRRRVRLPHSRAPLRPDRQRDRETRRHHHLAVLHHPNSGNSLDLPGHKHHRTAGRPHRVRRGGAPVHHRLPRARRAPAPDGQQAPGRRPGGVRREGDRATGDEPRTGGRGHHLSGGRRGGPVRLQRSPLRVRGADRRPPYPASREPGRPERDRGHPPGVARRDRRAAALPLRVGRGQPARAPVPLPAAGPRGHSPGRAGDHPRGRTGSQPAAGHPCRGLTGAARLTRMRVAPRSDRRRSLGSDGVDTERSGPETEHTGVRIAHEEPSPVRQGWRRVVFAALLLLLTVGVIYLDRDGYRDGDDVGLSLLDSFYYATVTLSTTGYGDITPITPAARLVNILLITPLRITFLLVLIGTTLEALTARSREEFRIRRWRHRVRQHVIVCGYGTKGRSAIRSLQALGTPLDRIVVVDPEPRAVDEANSIGLTGIVGDAGRTEVLRRASVERARAVIVAANRDDASVLITLTVRQLNPTVPITTSVREEENANLLRQSGADTVITTSATSGRLLGLSTDAPRVVAVVEDLVTGGQGLDLHQRRVTSSEVGLDARSLRDIVLSVTRSGRTLRFDDPLIGTLQPEDELVVVRSHH